MRFVANRNYEGQDIEVQKISKGNNTLIDLILKLTKKFDAFVVLQEKNWSEQRKVNEEQRKFNAQQEKNWSEQRKVNEEQRKFNQTIIARLDNIDKRIDNLVKKNKLKE